MHGNAPTLCVPLNATQTSAFLTLTLRDCRMPGVLLHDGKERKRANQEGLAGSDTRGFTRKIQLVAGRLYRCEA